MGLIAVVALAIAIAAPLLAPSAGGAVVGNPGNVEVSMRLSVLTPTFTVAGMSTVGTGTATVRRNGLIKIPQTSVSFQPVNVQLNLPAADSTTSTTGTPSVETSTVSVQAVATGDFNGGLDPKKGTAFLVGDIELLLSSDAMSDCPIGPFQVIVRSNATGGEPYSSRTGIVSMVDPDFALRAIPSGTQGCAGFESGINSAISLPITTTTTTSTTAPTTTAPPSSPPPTPSVVVSLTFVPAPQSAAAEPTPVIHRRPNPPTTAATHFSTVTPPPATAPYIAPAKQPTLNQTRNHPKKTAKNPNKKRHPNKTNPNKKRHPKKAAKPKKAGAFVTPKTHTPGTYLPGGRHAPRPKVKVKVITKKVIVHTPIPAPSSRRLNFVTAAFVKHPSSALSTGMDLLGLLGLLIFSSLALWLVTTEVSSFSASARRQRTHRIAGITKS